jgi:hypothetical protein
MCIDACLHGAEMSMKQAWHCSCKKKNPFRNNNVTLAYSQTHSVLTSSKGLKLSRVILSDWAAWCVYIWGWHPSFMCTKTSKIYCIYTSYHRHARYLCCMFAGMHAHSAWTMNKYVWYFDRHSRLAHPDVRASCLCMLLACANSSYTHASIHIYINTHTHTHTHTHTLVYMYFVHIHRYIYAYLGVWQIAHAREDGSPKKRYDPLFEMTSV